MQEALPYKRWEALPQVSVASASPNSGISIVGNSEDDNNVVIKIIDLVKEKPVIVFGKRGCFMCHVVRKLLLGLGVNPPVFEINADFDEALLLSSLSNIILVNGEKKNSSKNVNNLQFPLVFVGGKLFGGLDKVMGTHLSGELVPILKQAGALWL